MYLPQDIISLIYKYLTCEFGHVCKLVECEETNNHFCLGSVCVSCIHDTVYDLGIICENAQHNRLMHNFRGKNSV